MEEKIKSRVLQDIRKQSRISVQMECRFKSDDIENDCGALMLDLSQGGALLSSTLLPNQEGIPDEESKISITLQDGSLKAPLTLKGTVKRSTIGMSEYGKVAQFGVEFEDTPLALLRLISTLSSNGRRKLSRVSANMNCRFRSDDKEYNARIFDLSQNSAILSSTFIPALKSEIFMILDYPGTPLTIKGIVVGGAISGHGKEEEGQFEVEFENAPPELSRLINTLSTKR